MRKISIRDARIRLSKLVDEAFDGEPFIITKAGKPLAKVLAINVPNKAITRRLGFMTGEIQVPDDFDRMGHDDVQELFGRRA